MILRGQMLQFWAPFRPNFHQPHLWQLNENEYGSDIWSETLAPYVSYTSKIIVKTNILPILRMPWKHVKTPRNTARRHPSPLASIGLPWGILSLEWVNQLQGKDRSPYLIKGSRLDIRLLLLSGFSVFPSTSVWRSYRVLTSFLVIQALVSFYSM